MRFIQALRRPLALVVAASLAGCTFAHVANATALPQDRVTVPLPEAKFSTGDDPAWKDPAFDDRGWKTLSTHTNYEQQGYPNYNGWSWYRLHVFLPSSLKAGAKWSGRLRVFLSAIDDVDETYFNGVKIGQSGRFPDDTQGYDTKWQAERDYHVDADSGLIRWDADNVIAVRVYDGSGGGGFHEYQPFLSLAEKVDGIRLERGRTTYRYLADGRVESTLSVGNVFPVAIEGTLAFTVRDAATDRELQRGEQRVNLPAGGASLVTVTTPGRAGIEVTYRFIEASAGLSKVVTQGVPYLLTPAVSPAPRLNGAAVAGGRPGSPFRFRVAATGERPLRFAAQGLPAGLTLDPVSGMITGTVGTAGDYVVNIAATNARGSATRPLRLRFGETLALTPPMGWNSWNVFGLGVTADDVRRTAQAMVDSGLADHGWTYINVDDGWQAEQRAPDGTIRTNAKFPDMGALAADVHALGLKFGTYSSPGPLTCGRYTGSWQHEAQDAATYAAWGVDYLKYDLCSYEEMMSPEKTLEEHQKPYRLMGAALRAQPRDIVYSLCQYGARESWLWGRTVNGNSWRTTGDIEDTWASVLATGFKANEATKSTGPGGWADPDMLVVGRVGWGGALHPSRLTPDEQYSHISLWSLLAAPLLLGNDLTALDEFTRNLLTNDEVLAVNQDPLGKGAVRTYDRDGWQVWVKPLADGSQAVGIFNLGDSWRTWALDLAAAGLPKDAAARDLWRQQPAGALRDGYPVGLPAHGVLLLKVAAR